MQLFHLHKIIICNQTFSIMSNATILCACGGNTYQSILQRTEESLFHAYICIPKHIRDTERQTYSRKKGANI